MAAVVDMFIVACSQAHTKVFALSVLVIGFLVMVLYHCALSMLVISSGCSTVALSPVPGHS